MDKEIKSHISKLAGKFNYDIEYRKEALILKNEINEIELCQTDKYGISITYNLDDNRTEKLKVKSIDVYNVILDLLPRKVIGERVILKTGVLLTINEWIEEEGEFARDQLKVLKRELKSNKIECKELGGNRYNVEYYNGLLILKDDLCWAKSNVIPL